MIKLQLVDQDTSKILVVPGKKFESDLARIHKLPTVRAEYGENADGDEVFKFWKIPRIDLADILDIFRPNEIMMDKAIQRDKALLERLIVGPDPGNKYKGIIKSVHPLHAHQDDWVRTDPNCRRIFNLFGTGAGKTLMSLERAELLGAKRILVLTINGIMQDWEEESAKWLAKLGKSKNRMLTYVGTIKQREKLREEISKKTIVFASYQLARELDGTMFNAFILDEQDILANPETKRARELMPLLNDTWAHKDNQVIIQTATPTGNTPSTAYLANWLLHPLLSGTYESFRSRHETLVEWDYKSFPVKGPDGTVRWVTKRREKKVLFQNKAKMIERIKNYSSDATVVYPFVHKKLTAMIDMTDDQREVYEELRDDLESYIGEKHIKAKEARTRLLRLLQAGEGLFNFDINCLESGKLDYIIRFLKKTDHKVLVWSRFRPILDVLQAAFPDTGVLYHGGLTRNQRKLNRWYFNGCSDNKRPEFEKLLESAPEQIKIHKPGEARVLFGIMHDMTSRGANFQAADYALITTLTFSGKAYVQTLGRHARLDQKASIIYSKHLLSEDTNELQIKEYIQQRLMDMSLTAGDDEALNINQIREIAKIAVRKKW
jgi:hypothetical protein